MNESLPRVLHLITSFAGGPGRLLCDMLTVEEAHRDHRHVVCSMYGSNPGFVRALERWHVPVSDLAMSNFFDLRALGRLRQFACDFRPEILHTRLFRADFYGLLLGSWFGIPVRVASILNTDDVAVREDYGRFFAAFFIVMYRFLAGRADGFIASSREVALNLERKKIRPSRMEIHPNSLNLEAFHGERTTPRDQYRRKYGLGPQHVVIGSASVFNRRKGLSFLIRAFAGLHPRYPFLKLFLPGDGPEKTELEKAAAEQPDVRPAIVFPGPVDNMADFLEAVDIYAQPALSEGLPMAVLQAMAAAKPIVATRVGGIPEALREGIDGLLVAPRNTAALGASLQALIDNPELGRRLGESARARVEASFNARSLALETSALYDLLSKAKTKDHEHAAASR